MDRLSAAVLATILLAASLRAEQHVLDLTVPVAAQLDGGGETGRIRVPGVFKVPQRDASSWTAQTNR